VTLHAVQRRIAALAALPAEERREAAAALVPDLSDALAMHPWDDLTQVRQWVQLARRGTGQPLAIGRIDHLTPTEARRLAEAALGQVNHLALIATARADRDAAEALLHRRVGDAKRAGLIVDDIRTAAGLRSRTTVYEWTDETA